MSWLYRNHFMHHYCLFDSSFFFQLAGDLRPKLAAATTRHVLCSGGLRGRGIPRYMPYQFRNLLCMYVVVIDIYDIQS